MASLSNYAEEQLLNHTFRDSIFSKLTNLYVALFTADPTDAGTGAEVSTVGTGYARELIAVADASWTAPADIGGVSQVSNLVEVQYDDPISGWGTPSHWGLADAVTAGNLIIHGPIGGTLREVVADDDPVSFAIGALNISFGQATSLWFEAAVLNHILRTATFAKIANLYVGLHTEDPTRVGGIGEFTGTNYARVALGVANSVWTAPADAGTDKMVSNAVSAQFGAPGSEWGTYNFVSISDALSAGNLLFRTQMVVPRNVQTNDNPPIFLPGNLQCQVG